MNLYLKQFIIILITFFLILWFQNCDDKKNKKERTSYHDKYKLPILVCALLGLILNFNDIFYSTPIVEELVITEHKTILPVKTIQDQQIYTELPDF